MSPLWVLPLVVLAAGAVAVAVVVRRLAAEAAGLRREVDAVAAVGEGARALAAEADAALRRGAEVGDLRGRARALRPTATGTGPAPGSR